MLQRDCHWHPGRRAIGVCVETRQPMCNECSTRYDGVNYSKAGLAQMLERLRATERRSAGGRGRWITLLSLLALPVSLAVAGLMFQWTGLLLIDAIAAARQAAVGDFTPAVSP